jgi:hypothetical protein
MIKQVGITLKRRPSLNIVTHWNSTYLMLESTYLYKRAFESLTVDDSQYVYEPLDEEWKLSKKLCDILETFCAATKMVSRSKYPSSSCYFHQFWEVKKILELESSNSDSSIMLKVHKMKEKLQKYWDLSYMQICIPVILDPRFKLGFIKFRLQQGSKEKASMYFSKVEKTFQKLFDEYTLQFGDLTHENASASEFDSDNPWIDWGRQQNVQQRRRANDLDMYLEEEMVPVGVDLDLLQYWKTFSPKYPVLAWLTREVLVVPASTVALESAFSSAEKTISDYRSRLCSDTPPRLARRKW